MLVRNSEVDCCFYFLDKGYMKENIYLILYVDDLVIVTGNIQTMDTFKAYLKKHFEMVDLQQIKLFLGIRIEFTEDTVTLDQISYLKSVLNKFNMNNCKQVDTPLPSKLDYSALNSDVIQEAPCKHLIGCLMYTMLCTRPDICAAVNILSRYQAKNNSELWKCLKRMLRYINGSLNMKLRYVRRNYKNILVGYVKKYHRIHFSTL